MESEYQHVPADFVPCETPRKGTVDRLGFVRNTYKVIAFGGHAGKDKRSVWVCECQKCGAKTLIRSNHLVGKKEFACPCVTGKRLHGLSNTDIYGILAGMKNRCFNTNDPIYPSYGGRGITVCYGWRDFPEQFSADTGPRPSKKHSVDRIDNNGNYSCGHCEECLAKGWKANCRWATQKTQGRNRNNNVLMTYRGETLTQADWVDRTGITQTALSHRICDLGWSVEDALSTPMKKYPRRSHAGKHS